MKTSHRLGVLFAFIVLNSAGTAFAQESTLESAPIPGDAHELDNPSYGAFRIEEAPEKFKRTVEDFLKDLPPFFRDTTLKVNIRNFYFARQDAADAPNNDKEKISWALGGSAQLKTGKLYDIFEVRSELFTSQRLYGPEDKDGALLLQPGQDGYTVLGVANPRFEHEGNLLTLYRQRMDLPYINSQENRMTPNTFESYSYAYLGEGDKAPFQLGAGYIDQVKKRNEDNSMSMSEGAGVANAERGMPWAGFRVRPTENVKIVAVDYVGLDFLNFLYSDAEYSHKIDDDWSLKSSAQFSEQRSIGDDLLTGTDVSVGMWGVQQAASYKRFMLRAALTVNDKGRTLVSPFGTYPGFNSSIVEDFNRAGETAWKVGVSYDFAEVGLDGVSAYADYIQGNGAVDDNKQDLNDKREVDVNIDYRIKDGMLKGFWLRNRAGFVREATVGTTNDYRIILNYEIPIL